MGFYIMDSTSQIVWGILFGAIGLAFFTYGRKQRAIVPLITGIALCVFPYFISNVYLLVIGGTGLIALPYFVRI
jgi:predicted membrane protein